MNTQSPSEGTRNTLLARLFSPQNLHALLPPSRGEEVYNGAHHTTHQKVRTANSILQMLAWGLVVIILIECAFI